MLVDGLSRPAVLRLVQSLNLLAGTKEEWDNRVSALFAKIAAGDVIPNGSGLAGAEALTKTEVQTLLSGLAAVLTDHNTAAKRLTYAQAIGGVNMVRE